MLSNSLPTANVKINVDKDPKQNDIPKNIIADINIDHEINRNEIIKLFYQSMNLNNDSLKVFLDNERDFIYLLRKLKYFITPEQLEKINNSFFEIRKLLFDTANIQDEKMKIINTSYKENKIDFRVVAVLFILISIIGIKNSITYF